MRNLNNGSGVNREIPAPFCEGLGVKFPGSTLPTAILLSPEELCEKLAALVPCPEKRTGFCPDGGTDRKKVKNHNWAKLLAPTFKVDVGTCPNCGEDMEIIGTVQDQWEVQRYLRHIGMKEHPPPIAPARYVQAELAYDDCFYEDNDTE